MFGPKWFSLTVSRGTTVYRTTRLFGIHVPDDMERVNEAFISHTIAYIHAGAIVHYDPYRKDCIKFGG